MFLFLSNDCISQYVKATYMTIFGLWIWFFIALPLTPRRELLFLVDLFHLLCESLREGSRQENQLFIAFFFFFD